eukprot:evm.model.scf_3077.1 EVM.evm.TU.scf_3077.1   scf_3077:11798-13354(-)
MSATTLAVCLLALGSTCLADANADGTEQLLSSAFGPAACIYGEVLTPTSVEEVQRIVREARAAGRRVRALGSRHSLHDIICTGRDDDVAIDMRGFVGVEVAADKRSATIGAGTQLGDALTALEAEGVMMLAMPQFLELTIGGLLGTGAHGSTLLHPTSLSDQALAMTIVDGRGEVVVATGDLLKSVRIHLGVMGVVLNVTLPVRDLIKLRMETQVMGEEAILQDLAVFERARTADLLSVFWVPGRKQVAVTEGVAVPFESEGEVLFGQSILTAEGRDAQLLAHAERNASFFCDLGADSLQNGNATGRMGSLTALSCATPGDCGFDTPWQDLSVAVDLEDLPAALRRSRQVMDAMAACLPPMVVRVHRASENHMSMAWGADKAAIDVAFAIPVAPDEPAVFLGALQAVFQTLIHEFGGVPHWAKNGAAFWGEDFAPAAERFPRLADFLTDMRSMDPDGVFQNAFFRRAIGEAQVAKFPGCALTDKCICDVDAHCGRDQVCVTPTLPDGRDIGAVDVADSK